MPEDTPAPVAEPAPAPPAPAPEPEDEAFDKPRAMRTIAALRDELKTFKAAAQELAALKAERETRERQAAEESGQYRTLYEQLQAKLADAERTLAQERRAAAASAATRAAGLPDELAARLVGETPEELEADAKRLATFMAPPPAPDTDARAKGAGVPDAKSREAELFRRFPALNRR